MEIVVRNLQRRYPVNVCALQSYAELVLPLCLAAEGAGDAPLPALDTLDITIVSDARIAKAHRDFMGIDGATDVITFQHGEIVIGAGVGARQASEYGVAFEQELKLYITHGMLHLNGHSDLSPSEAACMQELQESILYKLTKVSDLR